MLPVMIDLTDAIRAADLNPYDVLNPGPVRDALHAAGWAAGLASFDTVRRCGSDYGGGRIMVALTLLPIVHRWLAGVPAARTTT